MSAYFANSAEDDFTTKPLAPSDRYGCISSLIYVFRILNGPTGSFASVLSTESCILRKQSYMPSCWKNTSPDAVRILNWHSSVNAASISFAPLLTFASSFPESQSATNVILSDTECVEIASASIFIFVEKRSNLLNLLPPVLSVASGNELSANFTCANFKNN